MSSFLLSLLSPVLRMMVCGNFKESIRKEISLDDVEAENFLKLMRLACGKEETLAQGAEELLQLGELAERLQMEAVRTIVEDNLVKELRMENCLEIIQQSQVSALQRVQKECYKTLRDHFGALSQLEGFLSLSEETMLDLLEEDEHGIDKEEDFKLFEALVRWMSRHDARMRGDDELLSKIRYGVMSNEYLAGLVSSGIQPGHGVLQKLAGEAMVKIKGGTVKVEGMWDGVERLWSKWSVARIRIIGADVLTCPEYVAVDGQGRIIVSDSQLNEIIVFNRDGSVDRRIGSCGQTAGQFNAPTGVAVDQRGHIIVADRGNDRIQVLNADGTVVRCFGSRGNELGQLSGPIGLAIDRDGHIVVADTRNSRIQVFDADGSVVHHFGSNGAAIGQLDWPTGVALDGTGRIVVADQGNHRVQVFNVDGSVALCFGSEGDRPGEFSSPEGVAVDSAGRLVVADSENDRVQVFNSDGSVARIIGPAGGGLSQIRSPYGLVLDGTGRMIVAECRRGNVHQVKVL